MVICVVGCVKVKSYNELINQSGMIKILSPLTHLNSTYSNDLNEDISLK